VDERLTLKARWVFPVEGAPLPGGAVTVTAGRVLGLEAQGRSADFDFGTAAILPGLVNAHTHLDLSGMRGLAPPSPDFTGWLRRVIAHRRARAPDQVRADVRAGLAECLRFGTTLVGDVSGDGGSWDALHAAPLWATVFRELLGLPEERAARARAEQERWLAGHPATPTCRPGVSPHAPYSVRSSLFLACSTAGVPAAVHLAETAAEAELLRHHRGPFVPFLRELGVWDPAGLAEDFGHVLRLLHGASPSLFVHANYLPPDAPFPANGSVVYCPRTHAAFGHPPHPFREFLARGVRVALGTDGLASNPDLDVLAEMRFLHRRYPDVPGEQVLRLGTLAGAEALGWHEVTGSLRPGKSADLVVVPLPEEDGEPHRLLLGSSAPVAAVLWRGRWVREPGRP
jgi:cytosine/adenosine deaminase-related metal-dependent hydrolase